MHADFHRAVGSVVRMAQAGEREAARKVMGEVFQLSNATVAAIRKLQSRIEIPAPSAQDVDEWDEF